MFFRTFILSILFVVATTASYGFGIVAISDNGAFGWSVNYLEYASAVDKAMNECDKNGGEDCYIPMASNNLEMHAVPYTHIYIARSGVTTQANQIVGLGFDFEEHEARKMALKNCRNLSLGQWVEQSGFHRKAPSTCKIVKIMYNKK